ncbi:UDP-glycosyltransferase 71E1-like [Euphorbia lathyris]|uniref:UDP-glycosyltransferase 71E1-like n=1 Tax=Euphorbia lathyris TaxID=212925 RepID=UPI0033136B24
MNLMFYPPSHHQYIAKEFSISDSEISIPGFRNPVPSKVLPPVAFNKDGGYKAYIQIAEGFHRVKGIIVNTFTDLESYAIESYKKGNYPKVYPIGPVLNLTGHPNPEMDKSEWDKIMKWLDDQPESSVVFLCFRSAGSFDEKQPKEIAMGLEESSHKFLWCIRFPTLPIYAEQQLNAFNLVKEWEIVVELKLDYRRNGEIRKEEVEKGVRSVMDSENERNKVKDMLKLAKMLERER